MKLELPLAIVLLATGGVLWIQPHRETKTPETPTQSELVDQASQFDVVQARQQKEIQQVQLIANQSDDRPSELDNNPPSIQVAAITNPAVTTTTNRVFRFEDFSPEADQPGIIVAQAAKQLEMSRPIACKARLKAFLFDQEVQGNGVYFHAGQGSGKSRLDFQYDLNEAIQLKISQVHDGNFFYQIKELGEERTINFVDLQQLNATDVNSAAGPTRWLSQSGTVSLLRNLSSAFEFHPPVEVELGGVKMLQVRGKWKRTTIAHMMAGQLRPLDEDNNIVWSRLPEQMPHAVEILLGNDEALPLFPYRISFFRIEESDGESDDTLTPLSSMELYEVQEVDDMPQELFRVNSDNSMPVDLSDDYLNRIQIMIDSAIAAAAQKAAAAQPAK